MLRFKPHILALTGLLILFHGAAVRVHSQATGETSVNPKDAAPEAIHFGDLIDVDVLGSVEYDWRGTITPEGFLKGIDFVEEPIFGLCQTEEAVARQIEKAYAKLLRSPRVVVRILDRSRRPVSVLYGAVKTPQRFQIRRSVRLNELIILSGGLTERASGEIQIFRPPYMSCQDVRETSPSQTAEIRDDKIVTTGATAAQRRGDGSIYININVADLLKGKPEANPSILTGDIVTIQEAAPVFVVGGVAGGGRQISSRAQTTVSRAVAAAGGLTKDADAKKVTIFRRAATDGETKVIEVDLDEINAEKAEDVALQAFDIVEVPQRGKDRRKFPPIPRTDDGGEKNPLNLPLRIVE